MFKWRSQVNRDDILDAAERTDIPTEIIEKEVGVSGPVPVDLPVITGIGSDSEKIEMAIIQSPLAYISLSLPSLPMTLDSPDSGLYPQLS